MAKTSNENGREFEEKFYEMMRKAGLRGMQAIGSKFRLFFESQKIKYALAGKITGISYSGALILHTLPNECCQFKNLEIFFNGKEWVVNLRDGSHEYIRAKLELILT